MIDFALIQSAWCTVVDNFFVIHWTEYYRWSKMKSNNITISYLQKGSFNLTEKFRLQIMKGFIITSSIIVLYGWIRLRQNRCCYYAIMFQLDPLYDPSIIIKCQQDFQYSISTIASNFILNKLYISILLWQLICGPLWNTYSGSTYVTNEGAL